jgi:hypothetical protein
MMVSEYVTHFTQLSYYAPNDVDTDEKKQEYFLNGLDNGLAYALEARDFENFQTVVDKALMLKNRRGILTHKRKQERQTQQSTNPSPHINASTYWARICHSSITDDSTPQSLSDSEHWESECSMNPNYSKCNTE